MTDKVTLGKLATGIPGLDVLLGGGLNEFSFNLISGAPGCGKTTLLQIAGLLDSPNAGDITIQGESLSKASDAQRTAARSRHLGFVYQFHQLLPEFSALENVMLPQMIAGKSRGVAAKKAEELLDSLWLSERLHHRPAKLSGGEQQRVAIARALANDPALILADEPTGNLDPVTADNVLKLLLEAAKKRGVAALVATHNPQLASRMDRTVTLEKGALR